MFIVYGNLTMMNQPTILTHPDSYKTGARVLFLVSRNKDGGTGGRPRAVQISYSPAEFDDKLKRLTDSMLPNERIYGSTEERDMDKAIRMFKERQLKIEDERNDAYYNFYKHMNGTWASCLQRNAARIGKKFLFDLDTQELKDEFDYFLEYWGIMSGNNPEGKINAPLIKAQAGPSGPVYFYRSKSGWHALSQPFNTKALLSEKLQATCHRNSMMLWAYT